MDIVRLKPYLRACKGMGLDEADIQAIENAIAAAPGSHPMMKGCAGSGKRDLPCPAVARAAAVA